jgi:nicotinate-nucleotide adenylyltransferase
MRVALYGGSFDPAHVGHLLSMAFVLGTARVERLLMVPCFRHPFDKRLSPYEHRLAMARLCAEPFGARVEVSDVERRLGGESRTLLTVRALRAERPGDDIVVVVGADLVRERERWYGYPELAALVDFFIVGRAGYPAEGAEGVVMPDVSSTEIRTRVCEGRSIEGLVPSAVADYVAAHRLYLDGSEP